MSSAAYLPPRPAPIPRRFSHRLLLAVFGAVLVAGAVIAGAVALSKKPAPPPAPCPAGVRRGPPVAPGSVTAVITLVTHEAPGKAQDKILARTDSVLNTFRFSPGPA